MGSRYCLAILLGVAAEGAVLHVDADDTFSAFVRDHARTYAAGSEEYARRAAIFRDRVAAVRAQNAKPSRRWTAGVNLLADRTDEELAALRGYRHGARTPTSMSLFRDMQAETIDLHGLPAEFSWRPHLKAMEDIQQQGPCGSCWAVAAATTLRAHSELFQKDRTFSVQQLVDCTPNPKHCGGDGGCSGATAELALDYAAKQGLVAEEARKYHAATEKCPPNLQLSAPRGGVPSSFLSSTLNSSKGVEIAGGGGAKFGLIGWERLPENRAEHLLQALYSKGPVAVSASATLDWSMYRSGIMDSCGEEFVVNHAIVLTGFGKEGNDKYWQIQNSWGKNWGEDGFMRLMRYEAAEENKVCGWDYSPSEGTACDGGPTKVWVCGHCGILFDSVIPKFRLSPSGWWHKHANGTTTSA
mmetsp:Transcript_7597/g.21595  ORF Transcript_7597/g.21595 Transcript_7597/m.21595 type:complete len:413 (+) Transcript_7597:60-1298(+)